jgi:hypothetical protein
MCLVCMAQAKPQMHLIEKWFQLIFMLLKLIEFIWENMHLTLEEKSTRKT